MRTMQLRCKAFSGGRVQIHKINVDDDGTVRVWDSVAGHFTTVHSLTARTHGKIQKCLGENNSLRPIHEYPNDPQGYAARVRALEAEGLTTSDAQSVADLET